MTLPYPWAIKRRGLRRSTLGPFGTGIAVAVAWTPCTGSALGAILEELGLIPAPVRVSGQRRYPKSAKEAITHALHCPHDDITTCRNFTSVVAARLAGQPLEAAHPH